MTKEKNAEEMVEQKPKSNLLFKLLIIVLVFVAVGAGVYTMWSANAINNVVPDRSNEAYTTTLEDAQEYSESMINILVVGTDAGASDPSDVGRADSIMICNVDLENETVDILSIPRDSRVEIPGYQYQTKINHSYAYGGIDLTKSTVENLLGVPIDYYAVVDFQGFEAIVETLGGVYIDVPISMSAHTYYGDIDLEPGYQLLDASEALGFVRYRYDSGGDIARAERQRLFLEAVFKQITSAENLGKISTLIPQIVSLVETDLSNTDIIALIDKFKDMDMSTDLRSDSVDGEAKTISGGSYWVIDEDALAEIVEDYFME